MNRSFETTQISLILRLRDKSDADAWEQFVSIYRPLIWNVAKRLGMSDEDANDACQNTLLRLSQVVHQWSPNERNSNFRGWLYRVARNCMLREFEKDKLRFVNTVSEDGKQYLDQLAEDSPEGDSRFQLELRRQIFSVAVEAVQPSVKPIYWEAFRLSYIEDHGINRTAEQLGISIDTVYVARHRVLNQIRQQVKRMSQWQDFLGDVGDR